jgi:hypothetical protein
MTTAAAAAASMVLPLPEPLCVSTTITTPPSPAATFNNILPITNTSNISHLSSRNDISSIQNSLIESFQQICSVEQMELCQKLGMLSKSEQQQAYKMAKALIEHRQIPVTMEDWNSLTEWVLMLRDRYTMHIESQCIRQHTSDLDRISHLDEVQRLSSLLEEYGQAHDDLTDLLQALKKLRNDWKHRKRDVENIILSILSSPSLLKIADYRLVRVTRSHLTTLGLGFSSIGKYYIVYESSMTDESKKDILNSVANDFGMVFQENAAQNLARMASSYHRIFHQEEEIDVIDEIHKLTQKVYIKSPNSVILPYPTSLPTVQHNNNNNSLADLENNSPATSSSNNTPQSKRESTFLERRKSIIILDNNDAFDGTSPLVFNMAKPLFEPAGWDWPHILKYKRPRTKSSGTGYWCRQILSSSNQKEAQIDNNGVWSTSISRLSDHFAKVGQDYYSNMLNNARLMHSHRAQMFEFATHSLLKTYRALQLEQGCANLSRTLVFLHRLQQESQRI